MQHIAKLAVARKPISSTILEASSVCVFCQHQQRPKLRRAFKGRQGSLNRFAARHYSSSKDLPADNEVANEDPEFEYEIAPESPLDQSAASLERQRRQEAKSQLREAQYDTQVSVSTLHENVKANAAAFGYEPAEDWRGLRRIGGKEEVVEVEEFENFFGSSSNISGRIPITAATYRAVVETLAALSAKANPLVSKNYTPVNLSSAAQDATISIQGADVHLSYPDETTEKAVLEADTAASLEIKVEEDKTAMEQAIARWGEDWLNISLGNQEFKFALVHRLGRILGRPIPDITIHQSSTIANLIAGLVRPDPPATVFEALERRSKGLQNPDAQSVPQMESTADLLRMSNVRFNPKRVSFIQKEKDLGRWKVIQQELQERGLPIPGSRKPRSDNTAAS